MNNTLIAQGPTSGVAGLKNSLLQRKTALQNLGVPVNSSIVGGRFIGEDRPGAGLLGGGSAWNRKSAGLADFLTFGVFDFDQRGNLGGGEHKAGGIFNRPGSGYGALAPGYTKDKDTGQIKTKPGFEEKDPLEPGTGTQKEGTRKEEAKQERINMEQEKYKMGTKLANENLMRAQLASIPDLMLRGGEGQAAIYSQLASDTLKWAQNLPKYQLPPMGYTSLRDYRLT
jgi:hypothetical protein